MERVLLLMHDCNDWPVAFLGCLYAGLVPVAVNTLLTSDDYAFWALMRKPRIPVPETRMNASNANDPSALDQWSEVSYIRMSICR